MELSTEMIELLELIIPIYGIANILFAYTLFEHISWQGVTLLVLGILYALLPMEDVVDYLFKRHEVMEEKTYDQAEIEFDTVYLKKSYFI